MSLRADLLTLAAVVALSLSSCGGLAPGDVPPESAIAGTVTFLGGSDSWPESNVYEVRVAAFEEIPTAPDSVISALLSGRAVASDTLPRYSIMANYRMVIPAPPRTFNYVVVAMRTGTNLFKDWLMISIYAPTGDPAQPGSVTVNAGTTVPINFDVDFNNLPPQPFE